MKLAAVISALVVALALAAAPPPFDFAGHWSDPVSSSKGAFTLDVDFASTPSPRRFTGTETLTDALGDHLTCTFKAKYRKRLKVQSTCDDGSRSAIAVRFDAIGQTLSGSFLIGRRHPARATFVLTRTGV